MSVVKSGLKLFVVMTLLVGVIYPLCVTGVLHLVARTQAQGSLIDVKGQAVGSRLIAQQTRAPQYFWPRPSACAYALPSGASNLSPGAKTLEAQVSSRDREWIAAGNHPSPEMVCASASGVDPDITVAGAWAQVDRVAQARHLTATQKTRLRQMVTQHIQHRTFGIWGEERLNVLALNVALDERFGK